MGACRAHRAFLGACEHAVLSVASAFVCVHLSGDRLQCRLLYHDAFGNAASEPPRGADGQAVHTALHPLGVAKGVLQPHELFGVPGICGALPGPRTGPSP